MPVAGKAETAIAAAILNSMILMSKHRVIIAYLVGRHLYCQVSHRKCVEQALHRSVKMTGPLGGTALDRRRR